MNNAQNELIVFQGKRQTMFQYGHVIFPVLKWP